MPVIEVERVHDAGADLVHHASIEFLDLAFTRYAVDALEVVLVVKLVAGAFMDARDVEGKAHLVARQQQASAVPPIGVDKAVAQTRGFKVAYDHCEIPYSAAARCDP